MGIDHEIHYDCEPKRALTLAGLAGRLKGRDRAGRVLQLYREQGDHRPPSQIGFEMVRRTPDGTEETEVIVVQDLLDAAQELVPWEPYCAGCPANRAGTSFGCLGSINYPISAQAERWLLDRLPDHRHPLVYMLLQRLIRERGYSGELAGPLRAEAGVFFESELPPQRDLEAVQVSGDQGFEMLFLSGPIHPAHGALLMQLFGAISPDLDAGTMMQLAAPPSPDWIDEQVPFLYAPASGDDASVTAFKAFFEALYVAFRLRVPVLLDV